MTNVTICDLFSVDTPYLKELFLECKYPWELIPKIKNHIKKLLSDPPEGFTLLCEGVLVGKDVKIDKTAKIIPPAVIGDNTEIRVGAYLRGNVIIGQGCVIGNSSELKNSILLDYVQAPHYNYIGDSVLGNHSHLGAGAICSNLKADKKDVVVHALLEYETGLRKLGAILGDYADIGCGCVLNPGTVIGKGTIAYPLNSLRGAYGEGLIIKNQSTIVKRQNR